MLCLGPCRVYGVEYSNFSLSDLYPHAVVELREPRSWAAANGGESHTEQLRRDAGGRFLSEVPAVAVGA